MGRKITNISSIVL